MIAAWHAGRANYPRTMLIFIDLKETGARGHRNIKSTG